MPLIPGLSLRTAGLMIWPIFEGQFLKNAIKGTHVDRHTSANSTAPKESHINSAGSSVARPGETC